jgi:hypothetical protein
VIGLLGLLARRSFLCERWTHWPMNVKFDLCQTIAAARYFSALYA